MGMTRWLEGGGYERPRSASTQLQQHNAKRCQSTGGAATSVEGHGADAAELVSALTLDALARTLALSSTERSASPFQSAALASFQP